MLESVAALIVYISLLEQQSKFGDALEILSGKLGSLVMIEVDRLRIQVLSSAFFSMMFTLLLMLCNLIGVNSTYTPISRFPISLLMDAWLFKFERQSFWLPF